MRFSVSSSDLLKKLQVTGGAIGSNPVLPILEDFLFTIKGNQLIITATDLETAITTQMDVEADKDGAVAVPAKILLETLKALPQQPITVDVDESNFNIEITSSYGKYKLAGENGADFPTIPEAEGPAALSIPGHKLTQGINKTIFATSNDELRPAMTGVYFQLENNELTLVATDAHKLVKYTFKELDITSGSSFIVPKKALNLLKGIVGQSDMIELKYNGSNVFFESEHTKLSCRLIDENYPNYRAVIPQNNPNNLNANRQDLQNSLKRIAIYANKTTNQVVLNINNNDMNISAQDLDFSNEASEQLSCSYEGDPLTIGFNAKFLIEMLGVMETDEIKMELSSPTTAGILLPAEELEDESILMLVMPVMLSV